MSIRQGKIIIADSVSSTTDYQDLINKPKINGVELDGNKTTEDLNINVGITSVNGDTGTNGAVTVKAIENANPNDTMLKIWNGTTAEYLALAEKDLNTVYNVTDEVTADSSKISGFNLFDFKWSDHLINNISWTRADNFSWHSAAVYVSAYNKLLKEKERSSTVLETETIDDITISFYRSENNYKICLPDQLANLTSLYEKTGVAWYYVIDTENKQFKLPRTKWGFTGLRNKAGDYVSESLPNITAQVSMTNGEFYSPSGAISISNTGATKGASSPDISGVNQAFSLNASRSSSTYQDGAPVQERATEMYLYFYVGNTVTVESEVNLDTLVTDVENLKKGSGGTLLDVANLKKNTLKTNQITNCITEIPQDIKLELNDGTLTLKAGSKVYAPNGVGMFDVVNITSDMSLARNSNNQYFCFIKSANSSDTMPVKYCYSGSSAPTITHMYAIWYDTTNNKIKWTNDNGLTWVDGYSLPICMCINDTAGTQNVSSIDQVFNGFGYIGSTIFALPGVKGLIPNGRNADGSLKNIEFTVNKVITFDFGPEGYTGNVEYIIGKDSTISNSGVGFHVSNEGYLIDEYNGKIKKAFVFASGRRESGRITSFTPKTVFHAVDYNDVTRHQVVSVLPANPDPNTFYYIPEE